MIRSFDITFFALRFFAWCARVWSVDAWGERRPGGFTPMLSEMEPHHRADGAALGTGAATTATIKESWFSSNPIRRLS